MNKYPLITVIFPTLDGGKVLARSVRSFLSTKYPRLEIIIVDNGSNAASNLELKKRKLKNLKILESKKNLGFAKAINKGAFMAKGDYLFVTNDDVLLPKNFFFKLVEFVESKNLDVSGVGGMKYNLYTGLFRKAKPGEIPDWIPGYTLFVKKRVWKRLGGFDDGFFFTFEDLDFCTRAKMQGLKIQAYPHLKIFHKDGATVNKEANLDLKYYEGYKSKIRFVLKHGSLLQKITNLTLQFLIYAPYRALILQEKSFIHLLRATFWNIYEKK